MFPQSLASPRRIFFFSTIRIPRARRALVFSILFALGTCLGSRAQNVVLTGELSGRVTDQSGAIIAGASVTLRNLATGVEQPGASSHAGFYHFSALMPGTYSVTATRDGFRDVVALVRILVGNTTIQDIKLQVGAHGDTSTVTATVPLLRPAEASASTVLDRSLLADLPLNGRKYTDFMTLTPNTSYDGDTGLVSIAGQQGGEDSGYANGNGSSAFSVDGSNATNNYFADIVGRNRIPYLYGEDSIEEFQVAVSPYSAIYGGAAGFVNAVTRSGGNEFHGSAFYYNRNSALGANDQLDEEAGIPKPHDSLQQFGAGVGGPIVLHHLWFFIDYEQQLRNFPISVINPALTTNAQNLSSFLNANFGIPAGTTLPSPNGPLPVPGSDTAPDPTSPVYLQQVANTMNALNSNLGIRARKGNDWVITPRLDYQPTNRDSLFLALDINRFNSPGGVILDPTVGNYGLQSLANAYVRTYQATVGWTHTFNSKVLNEFHAGTSQDNEIATPTGLAPNTPTIALDSPAAFIIGNNAFSVGRVFERQYSLADRIDLVTGKHTLQFGFDFNRTWDADTDDGGADPNEAIDFGSPLGLYEFPNLESLALGEYSLFSQAFGNPTFGFAVPYYGFYAQDSYRALPQLTLEMGLREDFQVYPQPQENPAFPLTGQYPNQFRRIAPRFGFAWQPGEKTVVRGGFGVFYTNMNGLNYRNAVISNGLNSQQFSVGVSPTSAPPNQQTPIFPNILPGNSSVQAPLDISLVSPQFRAPYILQASLQIEREIAQNTTISIGTMFNHGVHIISGSAYDLNLAPLQGRTTYVVCSANVQTLPCAGPSYTLPNMDNGLLTEGYVNPNLGEINELISPAQNYYNSGFVQLQRRMTGGLSLQFAYTFAKSMMLDGMDFNNQFDFSNTHAPSLLDERHKLDFAAVYRPQLERFADSDTGRALLEGWTLSTVMEFSSGRAYAGLLSPACTSLVSPGPATTVAAAFSNCGPIAPGNPPGNDNLNDSAFNEDTANTAGGINGAGPSPGIGLNSFYGPWLQRIDLGVGRSFSLGEGKDLEFQAQAFNLFNHPNYYVQNGDGINQIQYNPVGTNCGDGMTLNQTCYLVPNTGPGNFGTLQEISPNGLPRSLQFSARFTF
jgi:hypothetical protein